MSHTENARSAIENIADQFAKFLADIAPDLQALCLAEGVQHPDAGTILRQALEGELESMFLDTFQAVRDRDGNASLKVAA